LGGPAVAVNVSDATLKYARSCFLFISSPQAFDYQIDVCPTQITNQPINQPTNQPTNQSINQSINQPILLLLVGVSCYNIRPVLVMNVVVF
jgi:hypothetical protein